MVCRELLKIDMYSAALAPLPGSNAGGSGNCSATWNPLKDKLEVKVYLFGQTQTTGISLKQVSASIGGVATAVRHVLQQVGGEDLLGGRQLYDYTRVSLPQVMAQLAFEPALLGSWP